MSAIKITRTGLLAMGVVLGLIIAGQSFADADLSLNPDATLQEIREDIAASGYDFEVSSNPVFDKSPEELEQLLGRRQSRLFKSAVFGQENWFEYEGAWDDIPQSFDLRNLDGQSYIGPIHNQGNCGSCYAFAAAAVAEGVYNVASKRTGGAVADFSESYIAWHLGNMEPYSSHFGGCDDADYTYSELEALTQEGIVKEDAFPYSTEDPGVYQHSGDAPVVFESWGRVPSGDIDAIKAAILTYGSVVAAVYAGPAFLAYESGIYEDDKIQCESVPSYYTPTNHAVALVGWNDNGDADNHGYWILRNSWGTGWGENGYMRIKYRSARVACAVAYLEPADWPVVSTGNVLALTDSSAVISGTIDTQGMDTEVWVEYGTDDSYGSSSQATPVAAGEGRKSLTLELSGLDSQTTHHYRLAAYNGMEVNYGADRTFATPGNPLAPGVNSLEAQNVMAHSAMFKGDVNPHGIATEYAFEYGTTTHYGLRTQWVEAGTGTVQAPASILVNSLEPLTTYHYRIVATNPYGTNYGQDMVFTTDDSMNVWSQPPDCVSTQLHTSQVDPSYPFDAKTADDFMFETPMGNINKIRWWSRQLRADPVTPASWNIFIYSDTGQGEPGDLLSSWNIPGNQCNESLYYRDKDIYEYWADLDPMFRPEAGVKYWLVIQADVTWAPQAYWVVSRNGVHLESGTSIFPEVDIPNWTPHTTPTDQAFELFVDVSSTENATTGAAYEITDSSAYLMATIRPPGNGTVAFEYGLTDAYGNEVTADEYVVGKDGGRASRQQGVGAKLINLNPATSYHFRVAVKIGGTAYYGSDTTFTTLNPAVPQNKADAGQAVGEESSGGSSSSSGGDGGGSGGCFISSLDRAEPAPSMMAGLESMLAKACQWIASLW